MQDVIIKTGWHKNKEIVDLKCTLGDYFTRDYQTIWFREKEKMTFFILSCK